MDTRYRWANAVYGVGPPTPFCPWRPTSWARIASSSRHAGVSPASKWVAGEDAGREHARDLLGADERAARALAAFDFATFELAAVELATLDRPYEVRGMSKFQESHQPEQFDATSARNLASLIRALETDEQEPLTCAECREHFAALYHKLDGETPFTKIEQACVRHLTTCAECAQEFDALRGAMLATANGTLAELSQPYEFDLSFLTPSLPETSLPAASPEALPPQALPLWSQTIQQTLWHLVDEVQIRLEAGRAAFSRFPDALMPTMTTGMVTRGGGDDNQIEMLVLPAADAAFSIQLAVGPLIAGKAVVTVRLVKSNDAQPLQNTLVALRNSQRQLLLGSMSGVDGSALLEPLAQGRYFIQVQFNQQTWEVPLIIMGGSPLD